MQVPQPKNISYDENNNLIFNTSNYDYYKSTVINDSDLQALKQEIIGIATPSNLDSLKEIALTFGNNADFLSDLNNSIGLKAPLLNPIFTGRANFNSDVSFNSNVDISGTLKCANISTTGNTILSDAQTDTLIVNANSTFKNNIVIGDISTDTCVINATTSVSGPSTFTNTLNSTSNLNCLNLSSTGFVAMKMTSDPTNKYIYYNNGTGSLANWNNGTNWEISKDSLATFNSLLIRNDTTLGDNSNLDNLTVNAKEVHNGRSNFISDVSFNNNVDISGTLRCANISTTGNTVLSDTQTDSLLVNATSNFKNSVTIGDASTDTCNINATTSVSGPSTFTNTLNSTSNLNCLNLSSTGSVSMKMTSDPTKYLFYNNGTGSLANWNNGTNWEISKDSLATFNSLLIRNDTTLGDNSNLDNLTVNAKEVHNGRSNFNSDVSFNSNVDISGNFRCGNISTTGSTTLSDAVSDTLIVNANSTFKNNIVIGDISTDTCVINALSSFNSPSIFNSDVTFNGSINTTGSNFEIGNASLDTLVVNSNSVFNNNIQLGSSAQDILYNYCTSTHTSPNTFNSDLVSNGQLYAYGNAIFGDSSANTLQINSSQTSNGQEVHNGLVTFNSDVSFNGSIYANGSNFTMGNAQSDTLNVLSNTILNNNVQLGSSASDTLINNCLSSHFAPNTFNSDVSFNSSIYANGNCTIGDISSDILTIKSNEVHNSNEIHNGTCTFNGPIITTGSMTVGDASADNLIINSSTQLKNNVTIGDVGGADVCNINSYLNIRQACNIGQSSANNLVVDANSTFNGPIVINDTLTSDSFKTYSVSDVSSAEFFIVGDGDIALSVSLKPYFTRSIYVSMPITCFSDGSNRNGDNIDAKLNGCTAKVYKNGTLFDEPNVTSSGSYNFEKSFNITNNNNYSLEQFITNIGFSIFPANSSISDVYTVKLNFQTGTANLNLIRANSNVEYYKTSNVTSYSNTGSGRKDSGYSLFYYQFQNTPDEVLDCNTLIAKNSVIQNLNVLGSAYLRSTTNKNIVFDGESGSLTLDASLISTDLQSTSLTSSNITFTTLNNKTSTEYADLFVRVTTAEDEIDGVLIRMTDNETYDAARDASIASLTSGLATKQNIISSTNRLNTNLIANGSITNALLYTLAGSDTATTLQDQLNLKLPIESGNLTGVPTCPTAVASTNTTQIASTAFVKTAVANLINSASTTLDTLAELGSALGNDPNFATTMSTLIGTKAPSIDPTLTCNSITISPTVLSYLGGTSSNIQNQINSKQNLIGAGTNLTVGNLTTSSIVDNGNLTVKGATVIGNDISDSCVFYTGMTVSGLTKSHVGLSNVDNTSDINKPIGTATQSALNLKQDLIGASTTLTIGNLTTSSIVDNGNLTVKGATLIGDQISDSVTFFTGMSVNGLTKSHVGLGNVDNKSSTTIKSELLSASNTFTGTNTFDIVPRCTTQPSTSTELANKGYVDSSVNAKADDSAVVKLTGAQTVAGIKTFSSPPVLSGASITSGTIPQSAVTGLSTSLQYLDATSSVQTQINAKASIGDVISANNIFTGSSVLRNVLSFSENIGSASVSGGAVTVDFATAAVYFITNSSSATSFAVNLTNVNAGSLTNKTFNVSLIINAATYKVYGNSLTVNGTSRTMIYNNGSANIPALTSATHILQSINIIYTSSSTVPTVVVTNVAPYF